MTRRLMLALALILGAVLPASAQQGNTTIRTFSGPATGSCANIQIAVNLLNGDFYDCQSGTWHLVSSSGSATAFNLIGSGVNTSATMNVGTGATLTFSGSGVNNASAIQGVSISGTPATGQIPIASSSTSAAWADPVVSQPTAALLNATVVQGTGSNLHVVVDTAPTTAVTGTFFQATQPISAASLPLPANAAQETGGNLAAVVTNTGKIPSLGQALAAASVPVVLTAAQLSTLTPPAAFNGVVTQATGTNLHVVVDSAPTTAVTGTFWQATQPVSGTVTTTPPANASSNVTQFGGTNISTGTGTGGAGIPRVTVSSDSFPASQAVTGTFFQATQPVSIASMPSTPVTGTFWQATQPVSGTVAATQSGAWTDTVTQASGANLHVNVDAAPAVTGTVSVSNLPATQPVSGTVAVSNFPASSGGSVTSPSVVAPVNPGAPASINVTNTAFHPVPVTVANPQVLAALINGNCNATTVAAHAYCGNNTSNNSIAPGFVVPVLSDIASSSSSNNYVFNGKLDAATCTNFFTIRCIDTANTAGWSGADMGAWVNSAFTACNSVPSPSTYCDVEVEAGNYTFGTSISLPWPTTNVPSKLRLTFMPGAYVQYTGSGDAVAAIGTSFIANPNIQIFGYGAFIYCTGKVGNGIHFQGVTSGAIVGVGTTNCRNGIFIDGSNSVTIEVPNSWSNHVGIRFGSGTYYTQLHGANNNVIVGGSITGNDIWGVMDDATNQPTTTGNFHNVFDGTTIEGNGSATTSVSITSCVRATNVVTLTTATSLAGVVDGVVKIIGSTGGATSFNGWFKILTSNGTTQVTYAQTGPNESCTASTGTAQLELGNIFLEGGDSYLFNGVWLENNQSGYLAHAVIGTTNQVSNHQDFIGDTTGDPNTTSFMDNVNGQGTAVSYLRVPLAMTNIVNNNALSTGLVLWEPRGSFTNGCTGTCTTATVSMAKLPASGFGLGQMPATGATSQDITLRAAYFNGNGTTYLYSPSGTLLAFGGSAIAPAAAGGGDFGSASLPAANVWIGNAATNNIQLTGTASSAKVATLPNNTGTIAELNFAQSWTADQTMNTTSTGLKLPVLAAAAPTVNGNIAVDSGDSTLYYGSNATTQRVPKTCWLIADSTGSSSATLANITWAASCTFPVKASTTYTYACDVQSTSTNAAGGLFMGITGPATPVASNYALSQALSATTSGFHNISQTTAYSTTGAGVVAQTITTNWPAHFAGTFENGTNAGTLSIQFANGSATGSTVLKRGSFCTVQ